MLHFKKQLFHLSVKVGCFRLGGAFLGPLSTCPLKAELISKFPRGALGSENF